MPFSGFLKFLLTLNRLISSADTSLFKMRTDEVNHSRERCTSFASGELFFSPLSLFWSFKDHFLKQYYATFLISFLARALPYQQELTNFNYLSISQQSNMIKFFRRIRQRLLAQNRFNKYLIYAIGEISSAILIVESNDKKGVFNLALVN